ncbi:MAG TPA: TIGR03790 family protein, partial [Bacteroidetes bacterium]|nr:TIGR03790 family protein [Bacteroidota bacterium]
NSRFIFFLFASLVFFSFSEAQTINYNDVAVIINDSSSVSINIGNYFAQQRGIPPGHIIHVATSTSETIDSTTFEAMRSQIEAALTVGNLVDSINYLVTTKGMPLRISKGNACDSSHIPLNVQKCTCVESELPLILGANASDILQTGIVSNSYYNSNIHFDRSVAGIFLVSRLDGFTETQVRALIDHSGPEYYFYAPHAAIVLDYSQASANSQPVFQSSQNSISTSLQPTGLLVYNDSDNTTFLTNFTEVIAYSGIHFAPNSIQPNFRWSPGSIAHLLVSRATFSPISNEDSLVGKVIEEGVSTLAGYTSASFFGTSTKGEIFFSSYFDTTQSQRYNAAEAYYLASPQLSQQNILIGDPKTSAIAEYIVGRPEPELADLVLYPNPGTGQFKVQGALEAGDVSILIRNELGQLLFKAKAYHAGGEAAIPIRFENASAGLYFVQIIAGSQHTVKKLIIRGF